MHPCNICGKSFKWEKSLKTHIDAYHKEFPKNKCPHCSKLFTRASNLKDHIEQIHLQRYRFRCHVCDKGFARKKILSTHLSKVHNVESEPVTTDGLQINYTYDIDVSTEVVI